MFFTDRLNLVHTLEQLRGKTCAYAWNGIAPDRCDCKYSRQEIKPFSFGIYENTGCPELLNAVEILRAMTDEEYYELGKRRGNIL